MTKSFYGLKNEVHWNPITGCDATAISPGCDNCWARVMSARFGPSCRCCVFKPTFHPERLDAPKHWRKPRIVPTCFMGDWMAGNIIPDPGFILPQHIYRVYYRMVNSNTHTYLTLTKRADKLSALFSIVKPVSNIWLGVSAENQECYDKRALKLSGLAAFGWHTWLSIEPILGPIALDRLCTRPSWLVVGCESGPRRRPCQLEWVRDIVQQCKALGIPCYVKQINGDYLSAGQTDNGSSGCNNGDFVCKNIEHFPANVQARKYPKEFNA